MEQRTGSESSCINWQLCLAVTLAAPHCCCCLLWPYISSLHLGVILYLLSYYEVAQHTDDLPGTPLEWHPVSAVQFSGLVKPSAWMWSERGEWTAVVCVLCPLPSSAWQGLPWGSKSKYGATPERGFTPESPHLPLFCSSCRNASTSSLRRSTWNV